MSDDRLLQFIKTAHVSCGAQSRSVVASAAMEDWLDLRIKIAAVLQIIGRNFGVLFGPPGCRETDQKQDRQPMPIKECRYNDEEMLGMCFLRK
jgi:hypothetical protein